MAPGQSPFAPPLFWSAPDSGCGRVGSPTLAAVPSVTWLVAVSSALPTPVSANALVGPSAMKAARVTGTTAARRHLDVRCGSTVQDLPLSVDRVGLATRSPSSHLATATLRGGNRSDPRVPQMPPPGHPGSTATNTAKRTVLACLR